MDYELIPIEPGAAGKVHILKGTVVDPDGHIIETVGDTEEWVIKADVDIDGFGVIEDILVVYHCQYSEKAGVKAFAESEEEEEEEDNPLIIGGSPFVKDDRVIVLNYGDAADLDANNLKVVGYEDGLPRTCVFQFRITRDDGEIADETMFGCDCSLNVQQKNDDGTRTIVAGLRGYDPDSEDEEFLASWTHTGNVWFLDWVSYNIKCSYNTDTKIWTAPFYEEVSRKQGKDFWVEFHNRGKTISVSYLVAGKSVTNDEWFHEIRSYYAVPEGTKVEDGYSDVEPEYVYKEADRWQDKDLIVSKFYELKVPYVKVKRRDDKASPTTTQEDLKNNGCLLGFLASLSESTTSRSLIKTLTVDSSVDYRVNFTSRFHKGCEDRSGCPAAVFLGTYFVAEWYAYPWADEPPPCDDWCECEQGQASSHYWCKVGQPTWVHVTDSNGDESSNIETMPIESIKNVPCIPYSVQSGVHTMTHNYVGPNSYEVIQSCKVPTPEPDFPDNYEYVPVTYSVGFKFFCGTGAAWFGGVNYE